MTTPLVSVLVPCHNTARYLRETVESIQAQSVRDFELILLDDGSTDETPAMLRAFAAADPRIRTLSRPNKGLVDTRNELLAMASGQYVAWHDSDDLMSPRRLEYQLIRFAEQPGLAWLGGAATLMDPDGLPIRVHAFPTDHESIVEMMQREMACFFGSTLMPRELVLKAGGFRHPFTICEDFDLCLRMMELGRVENLAQVVFSYRQHMASTCNSGRPHFEAYVSLVQQLARERRTGGTDRLQRGETVQLERPRHSDGGRNRAETHRRWGWWALGAGHVRTARKYAFQAVRDAPLQKESWKLVACALRGH